MFDILFVEMIQCKIVGRLTERTTSVQLNADYWGVKQCDYFYFQGIETVGKMYKLSVKIAKTSDFHIRVSY